MTNPSSVMEILNHEHDYWEQREEEAPQGDKLVINGGLCVVKMMLDFSEAITREWLLAQHKKINGRKHETKFYSLASASIARDKMRLEAIVRVGRMLKDIS